MDLEGENSPSNQFNEAKLILKPLSEGLREAT